MTKLKGVRVGEMGNKKLYDVIKSKLSNIKKVDWLLIVLVFASFVGANVTFAGRLNFIYFCLATITCLYILIYRRIQGGKRLLKNTALFLGTMVAVYWSFAFYITSFPGYRSYNNAGEKLLHETEGFEKVSIPFRDGKLEGWWYRRSIEQEAPLFVFFCGAGECSADSMTIFYEDNNLMDYIENYDLLCLDYPGYGNSDGKIYEASMKSMALSIYDEIVTWDGIDENRITVAGYSIGTGPASYLAEKREIDSLILIATYDKYYHIGDADRSDLYQLECGYNLHPFYYAKDIEEPVLILTSDADTTCEYKSAKRVADRLKNCDIVKLSGVKHENMLCEKSFATIKDFLQ